MFDAEMIERLVALDDRLHTAMVELAEVIHLVGPRQNGHRIEAAEEQMLSALLAIAKCAQALRFEVLALRDGRHLEKPDATKPDTGRLRKTRPASARPTTARPERLHRQARDRR
jgi:hypothetical protein